MSSQVLRGSDYSGKLQCRHAGSVQMLAVGAKILSIGRKWGIGQKVMGPSGQRVIRFRNNKTTFLTGWGCIAIVVP
jgi:hypothetical protein